MICQRYADDAVVSSVVALLDLSVRLDMVHHRVITEKLRIWVGMLEKYENHWRAALTEYLLCLLVVSSHLKHCVSMGCCRTLV